MQRIANKISYSRLRPHAALFESGLPILTYHHVGWRPPGVRWRGLWVSPRLFARQMRELHLAGYRSTSLDGLALAAGNPGRKFAVTFDDGYASVLTHALPELRAHGAVGIQFLVAGRIGGFNEWDVAEGERPAKLMDAAGVRAWLDAGQQIGSHTLTHPRLTSLSRSAQRAEIRDSRLMLEDQFGCAVRHFCYPYGDLDGAVADLVGEAGYESACTHLDSGVNTGDAHRLRLKRIEARYPSRNLKAVFNWLRMRLRPG
ncbi:MAG: polysaccharide deacetylase family protein [Opitutaceae bacterium]